MFSVGTKVKFVVPIDKRSHFLADWAIKMVKLGEYGKIIEVLNNRCRVKITTKNSHCPYEVVNTPNWSLEEIKLFRRF